MLKKKTTTHFICSRYHLCLSQELTGNNLSQVVFLSKYALHAFIKYSNVNILKSQLQGNWNKHRVCSVTVYFKKLFSSTSSLHQYVKTFFFLLLMFTVTCDLMQKKYVDRSGLKYSPHLKPVVICYVD